MYLGIPNTSCTILYCQCYSTYHRKKNFKQLDPTEICHKIKMTKLHLDRSLICALIVTTNQIACSALLQRRLRSAVPYIEISIHSIVRYFTSQVQVQSSFLQATVSSLALRCFLLMLVALLAFLFMMHRVLTTS